MRKFRLILSISLSFTICWMPQISDQIYSYFLNKNFKKIGTIKDFQEACGNKYPCELAYKIPIKHYISEKSDILELGVGVISGVTQFFCTTTNDDVKLFESNSDEKQIFREGLRLYNTITIPLKICKNDLWIYVTKDPRSTVSVGWKSGSLVIGPSSVIRSYKSVIDFFSSHFRVLLALMCFILLVVSSTTTNHSDLGFKYYNNAINYLSIHLLASSSIFDVIIPNNIGFGFLILMSGGSVGCLYFIFSLIFLNKQFYNQKFKWLKRNPWSNGSILFFSSLFCYYLLPANYYLYVQSILAITGIAISIIKVSLTGFIFSLLFLTNILSAYGVFPGAPTNTATHFLLILFLIDSFERIYQTNNLMKLLTSSGNKISVPLLLNNFVNRFNLNRISTSMFTKDFEFITNRISFNNETTMNVEKKVSRIAAHVMTARKSLIRIKVGSKESNILKGPDSISDTKKGREFCIMPIIYNEKILGTLNISGYPIWVLAEPSQLQLFLSILEILLPKLAEVRYKEDLSPNIEDKHAIQELESFFLSKFDKSKEHLTSVVDQIAKKIDGKIIISEAIPNEDKFKTFSNHLYAENEAKTLEKHTPNLSSTLVTSPANVAYHHKTFVFINNIENMFSVYSDFLVNFLKNNNTKSLFVNPIYFEKSSESPWGVVWIEFSNRISRPESDLKELADYVSNTLEKMLTSHIKDIDHKNIVTEISTTVPKHVLEKIKLKQNPRENETGYLLNIDLAGSTMLSKEIGPEKFLIVINELKKLLSESLEKYGFTHQIIVWDSFAFTKASENKSLNLEQVGNDIINEINNKIITINKNIPLNCQLGFRAVITYGDITRDWSSGSSKYWSIVGHAYAESCKLEHNLKPQKGVLLISSGCGLQNDMIIKLNNSKKKVA